MNPASEIAIRWYLSQNPEISEESADGLVRVLFEGCGKGEADYLQFRDNLLIMASQAPKDDERADIINSALSLHFEFEENTKASRNLEQLEAISAAVADIPENGLAKRIKALQVRELAGKIMS